MAHANQNLIPMKLQPQSTAARRCRPALLLCILLIGGMAAAADGNMNVYFSIGNGAVGGGATFSAVTSVEGGYRRNSPSAAATNYLFSLESGYISSVIFGPESAGDIVKFRSIYGEGSIPVTYIAAHEGGLKLNLSTGLLEQRITVENSWITAGRGLVVFVEGLPGGVTLYNRTGETNGMAFIKFAAGTATGSKTELLLEFFSFTRATNWSPVLTAVADDGGSTVLGPPSQTFGIRKVIPVTGGIQIEFESVPGVAYRIQYKDDATAANWTTVNEVISVQAKSATWVDHNPPAPGSGTGALRLYRVIQARP